VKGLQRIELLKDMAQQAIDRGATSVEQIHQYIAGLPFELLEKTGVLDDDKLKLRDKQRRTIGMVYDAIRSINRQIGEMISDQFELAEDGKHIAQVLAASKAKSAAPKKKTATRKAVKKAVVKKTVAKKAAAKKRPRR